MIQYRAARQGVARCVLLMASIAIAPAIAQAELTLQEVLSDIEQKASAVHTYRARVSTEFSTLKSGKVFFEQEERLTFKRPNKLNIKTTKITNPNLTDTVTVSDGSMVWMYTPLAHAVDTIDLNRFRQLKGYDYLFVQPAYFLAEPIKEIRRETLRFLGIETFNDAETYVLEGQAQSSRSTTIKAWVRKSDGLLVKYVKTKTGPREGVITATVSDIEPNIELADEPFVFKIPEGVKVIDRTAE